MRTVFATIKKNNSENVQVAFEIYKKQPVIDVRVPIGNGNMSTKGLTAGVHVWKALVISISEAIEEFEKQLSNPESELGNEVGS